MRRSLLVIVLVALLAACDWPQYLYGPEHTSSSPDTSISASDISAGRLTARWSAPGDGTPPVVADGSVFRGGVSGGIAAFDAGGTTGCSGSPRVCSPRWIGLAPGVTIDNPAVSGDVVVGTGFDGTNDVIAAFDARGTTHCTGTTPELCAPLWTATTSGPGSTVTLAAGVLYQATRAPGAESAVQLVAYDVNGSQNCSGTPVACAPLWTAQVAGEVAAPVSVSGGLAYLVASTGLYAFDAAGSRNCAFSTCEPLWVGAIAGGPASGTDAVVANGTVFVAGAAPRNLYGFDAAGQRGCSVTLGVCQPVWNAAQAGPNPSVADGLVYVNTPDALAVFDATGSQGCAGTTVKTCVPLRSYDRPGADCYSSTLPCSYFSPPVIANGVVYQGYWNKGTNRLTEYDATGANCGGTPPTCPAIGSQAGGSNVAPAVSNGFVYDPALDGGTLIALGIAPG